MSKNSSFFKSTISKVKNFSKDPKQSEKLKKIIIITGFIGIALIAISSFPPKPREKSEVIPLNDISTEEYRTSIESSLQNLVSEIRGCGKAKVLVTVESDAEKVYATEHKQNIQDTEDRDDDKLRKKKSSNDSELKYITVKDSHGAEKALPITQIEPKIKGVVIVCDGGNDPATQEKIISVVTTALNISSNRVFVTK